MAGFAGTQAAAVMDFWYSSPHAVLHANHDPAREALASHALRPKASRRNPRGCLKFGKVRGTPMQREPILLQNLSYPPGLRWDPLGCSALGRFWEPVRLRCDIDRASNGLAG